MCATRSALSATPRGRGKKQPARNTWFLLLGVFILGSALVGCGAGSFALPPGLPPVSGGGLLAILTTEVVDGIQGRPYVKHIETAGSTPPLIACTITLGALPPGLSIGTGASVTPGSPGDDDECIIFGTPTSTGSFNFTLEVRDSSITTQRTSEGYDLTIRSEFEITAFQVVDAVGGRSYSKSFKILTNLLNNPNPPELGSVEQGNGPITACSISGLPANMGFTCVPDGTGVALDVTLTNTGVLAATGPVALTITVTDSDIVQSGLVVVAGRGLTNATTSPSFAVTFTIRDEFSVLTPSPLEVVDAVVGRPYDKTFTFSTDLLDNGDDVPNDVNTGEAGNGPLTGCTILGLPADFSANCALDPGGLTGTINISSFSVTTAVGTLALQLELTDSPIPQASPLQVGPVVPARTSAIPFSLTIRNEFSVTSLGLPGGGTALPDGVEDRAYDFSFTVTTNTVAGPSEVGQVAESGNGPIAACVLNGTLPAGLVPSVTALLANGCTIRIQGTININPPTAIPAAFGGLTITLSDTPIQQASVDVVPAGAVITAAFSMNVVGPMTLTLTTVPNVTFVDNAAGTTGLAPGAVIGRTYGAPAKSNLVFSVTGGLAPHSFSIASGSTPAGIGCTQPTDTTFVCNSGGVVIPGGSTSSTFRVQVVDNVGGGNPAAGQQTIFTDTAGHTDHTINVTAVLALTPNPAVDPPPLGVVGRTYGNSADLTCTGGACVPLTYTASGGLLPYVPSLPGSVPAPAVNGVPAAIACGFATPVATCTTGASTITAATGPYPFEVRVVDTTNDTTAQGIATVPQSVTIFPALEFSVLRAPGPAGPFTANDPIPPGVEGRRYVAFETSGDAIVFKVTDGTGLLSYNWDTPVAGLPGDLECAQFSSGVAPNDELACFAQAVSGGAALPQPAAGTFTVTVTVRDPGNTSTPAGAQSTDNLTHPNHDIIINDLLALAISVGDATDLPEAVDARPYADSALSICGATGTSACQALIYTASGGLGDPTGIPPYVFSANTGGLTPADPGNPFPSAIACTTGANPNADELTCTAPAASPVNVTTPGTFTPSVQVVDVANVFTINGSTSEQRNLEVNDGLLVSLSPDPAPDAVNGRTYGSGTTCDFDGAFPHADLPCAPQTWIASGGLGDPTVTGSYVFTENATGLTAPGSGFPLGMACATQAAPDADDHVCSALAIAVTTTGLYQPGVSLNDVGNETTPSGLDSGTPGGGGTNLVIHPELEFTQRVTPDGVNLTDQDPFDPGVNGRNYANIFAPDFKQLISWVPTAGFGLGTYDWDLATPTAIFTSGAPSAGFGCGFFTAPNGANALGCREGFPGGTNFPAVAGTYPYTVTLRDPGNLSTPAGVQQTDNLGHGPGHPNHSVVINPALSITSLSPLDSATDGDAYFNLLTGAGGLAASQTWSVFGEAGPPFSLNSGDTDCDGLSMDAAGLISGTSAPTPVDNNCPFTAILDDAGNTLTPDSVSALGTASKAFILPVAGAGSPVIDNDVLINGLEGFLYTQSFTATGGGGGNTWVEAGSSGAACPTVGGAVPTGTALGAATGILTGASITAGTFDFGVCVEDAFGGFNLKNFSVVINDATAYVTNFNGNSTSVIDTAAAPPVEIAVVAVGTGPRKLAITPDGTRAYVTDRDSSEVSVIDTTTNTVVATVPTGAGVQAVAIKPDGTRAYTANSGVNSVDVIDTSTNLVVNTIAVGTAPQGIAITPDGAFVYTANSGSNNVSVIDTATETVVGSPIAVGTTPRNLAVSPDGTRVYVNNAASNNVSVIDTATNTVVATVTVGVGSGGVAFSPDGTRAYVINGADDTVSVIDTTASPPVVVDTVTVGAAPAGVAFTPDGTRAYVANRNSDNVSVIDTTAVPPAVADTVTVGDFPFGVATMPYPVLHFTTPAGNLTDATNGVAYESAFVATGGVRPLTWSEPTAFFDAGGVGTDPDCDGLTIDFATGVITGVPSPSGGGVQTCGPFDITVTDSATVPQSVTRSFSIVINP